MRKLLDIAAQLIGSTRLRACSRQGVPYASRIALFRGAKGATARGVYRCGATWTCPVCSTAYLARRREEIRRAVQVARQRGLNIYFLTLTASHEATDPLRSLLARFRHARRLLHNRWLITHWRRQAQTWHRITVIEVTFGASGWHVHTHELIITDLLLAAERQRISDAWERAAADAGLSSNWFSGVSWRSCITDDGISDYLSKWDEVSELTGGQVKDARGGSSMSILQLLAAAATDLFAAERYQEFAEVMPGTIRVAFSRNLCTDFGLPELAAEEEAAKTDLDDMEFIAFVPVQCYALMPWRFLDAVDDNPDTEQARTAIRNLVTLSQNVTPLPAGGGP